MMEKLQILSPKKSFTSAFISWKFFMLFLILASLQVSTITGLDRGRTANDQQPVRRMAQSHIGRVSEQEVDINQRDARKLDPKTTIVNADFQQTYNHTVNKTSQMLYIYSYTETNVTTAVRISVAGNDGATNEYPVMFVARQQEGILSWRIPLDIIDGYSYWSASRTLCPLDEKHKQKLAKDQMIFLGVSTMSDTSVFFSVTAERLENFELEHNKPRTEVVATSRPVYFMYTFPEGIDTVLLTVTSSDKVCMTVSIQPLKCPVMDLDYNVEYKGKHQTMSTRAALYLQRENFPDFNGFYVVFVVKPNNEACTGKVESMMIVPPAEVRERSKHITLEIKETITVTQYVIATVVAVAVFLGFYFAAALVGLIYTKCGLSKSLEDLSMEERDSEGVDDPFLTAHAPTASNYGAIPSDETVTVPKELGAVSHRSQTPSSPSLDESEIDFLPDADLEKDIFRTKTALFVSDLSRKKYTKQTKRYKLYTWNLLTIAIFYALPAVQLVITYHKNLNHSGNEDLCYYNFECAHPLKDYLSSFNNVFSNIGYVMLGLLFILIVYRKNRLHKQVVASYTELEKRHGIPQFFGLYYAMGFSLIMEGIMSASYHVCPNSSNFQFDTSFMYIIACLCMLKIYQTRHPDVNARAHTVYFSMAIIILVAVFGVVYGTNILWIFYALIHMFFAFVITAQIYFMGRWRISRNFFKQALLYIMVDCRRCGRPSYPNRFVLLFIANAINWAFALYGAIAHPSDFASFLLAIFIGNLLIYCVFYIVMKLLSKERLSLFVIGVILTSGLTWGGSLYFFFQHLTTWADTPAGSREGNRECIFLSFYDAHDVWHMLSAISLFLSFLILFMLDDDLKLKRRDRIPVF